jgi:hypothetical protein
MVAYTGGPMLLAGWRHPVVVDLAGLNLAAQRRPIRLGHDAAHGVGHTESVRVEGSTLVASGVVSRDTPSAREVVVSSKNGFPWQASIGASVDKHDFVREGETVLVNGQSVPGPVNVVRQSRLQEISFVDLGADGNTSASVAASHSPIGPATAAASSGVSMLTIPTLAALIAAEPTHAGLIAQAAAEEQTEDQIRAKIATVKATATTEALKASEQALATEKAAHETTKTALAALDAKHQKLMALATGAAKDPGADAANTKPSLDAAAFEALSPTAQAKFFASGGTIVTAV